MPERRGQKLLSSPTTLLLLREYHNSKYWESNPGAIENSLIFYQIMCKRILLYDLFKVVFLCEPYGFVLLDGGKEEIMKQYYCVEPPGLEPGMSACKAEVLANYTMTP